MTQTPGWAAPEGDGREPRPPYPGWSVDQPPPAHGWGATPWTAPGGAPPAGGAAVGGAAATSPAGGPAPGWGWQPPAPPVKPGVVPLRPLGVGELLDGAVTTLRQNPAAMLGLSAVVAAATQLLQLGATWFFYRDLAVLEQATVTTGTEALSLLGGSLGVLSITGVLTWLATVLLTGILTVVVSRAVLGERVPIGEAWRSARPQLPRLVGLTVLVALIVVAPLVLALAPGLLAAAVGTDGGVVAVLVVVGLLVAVPVMVWLYVRIALATPALMLETSTDAGSDSPRRASVIGAIRRSSRLVEGSWWRVFGIILLAYVLALIISQVVTVPLSLVGFLVGGFTDDGTMTLPALALTGLGGIVATTLTAPFTAGVLVLLYVDRRIRREGLDIALARAAGVTLPASTHVGTGAGAGQPPSWGSPGWAQPRPEPTPAPRPPDAGQHRAQGTGWTGGGTEPAPWAPAPGPPPRTPPDDDGTPPQR